jgi:hypothetical protein
MGKKVELYDEKTLKEFGKDYVKILTIFLKKNRKIASGALVNSINFKLKETAEQILIILESNDYLEWVDKGRKPGKYPPLKAISEWARLKGISQDAVFPIAKKIFKFGIEPTNVIQDTITEIETSPTFRKRYEDKLLENVENIMGYQFEELNKKYR